MRLDGGIRQAPQPQVARASRRLHLQTHQLRQGILRRLIMIIIGNATKEIVRISAKVQAYT